MRHPQDAGQAFEERFADGDLEGLMDLYEDGAVFTTRRELITARMRYVRWLRSISRRVRQSP